MYILLFSFWSFSQTRNEIVREKVATEVRKLCRKYACDYVGNIKLTKSEESANDIIIEGKVDYKSDNCNDVTAGFTIKLKPILDEMEVTCFVLYMPFCVLGSRRSIDAEYTIGCCNCSKDN